MQALGAGRADAERADRAPGAGGWARRARAGSGTAWARGAQAGARAGVGAACS